MEQYWSIAQQYLNEQGGQLLLFLDNANTISPSEVGQLSRLGCKILLTSRKELDQIYGIEAGQLSIDDCRGLYRIYSKDQKSSDEVINQIIKLAARHTLSVELLAKTQLSAGMDSQE